MRFRVIVFDFDGTLVDSNHIKASGYDQVFKDRPACRRVVKGILKSRRTATRFEVIRSALDHAPDLMPRERKAEALRLTALYTTWVEDRILEKAVRSPARALLERWHREIDLYVCSLTPTQPLNRLLDKARWRAYFREVQGAPVKKEDMLRRTARKHRLKTSEVLMVGDGDVDEAAARAAGTAFFRVEKVPDLERLDQYLRS